LGGFVIDSLLISALASSTVKVLKAAVAAWADRSNGATINVGDSDTRYTIKLDQASPELLDKINELLRSSESKGPENVLELSRKAIQVETPNAPSLATERQSEIVGLALALDPDSVFRDARKRTGLVFQLNLGFAIILGIILLTGIAGSLYSALVLGKSTWALAFGGISAADLIGLYAFKPLIAINSALVSATRLDNMQLRLKLQLEQCSKYSKMDDRLRCQTAVWDTIQKELAALS
jgi:hypothetical protein